MLAAAEAVAILEPLEDPRHGKIRCRVVAIAKGDLPDEIVLDARRRSEYPIRLTAGYHPGTVLQTVHERKSGILAFIKTTDTPGEWKVVLSGLGVRPAKLADARTTTALIARYSNWPRLNGSARAQLLGDTLMGPPAAQEFGLEWLYSFGLARGRDGFDLPDGEAELTKDGRHYAVDDDRVLLGLIHVAKTPAVQDVNIMRFSYRGNAIMWFSGAAGRDPGLVPYLVDLLPLSAGYFERVLGPEEPDFALPEVPVTSDLTAVRHANRERRDDQGELVRKWWEASGSKNPKYTRRRLGPQKKR